MISLAKMHGFECEGGVLSKPQFSEESWDCHAIFNVSRATCFSVTVGIESEGTNSDHPYFVGIVPKSIKVEVEDIEREGGIFLECRNSLVYDVKEMGHEIDTTWPNPPEPNATFTMSFIDDSLYVSYEMGLRVKVVDQIKPGDYRPCVSVANPGTKLRISLGTPGKKRALDSDNKETLTLVKTLWSDRLFTDAFVSCSGRDISVHRCVLSAASPFFARAFQGEMREATERRIAIDDVKFEAVNDFVQYLYMKTLPETTDLVQLLTLAHRYEVRALVAFCISAMIDGLNEDNVVKYVAAVKPFSEDESIRACWKDMSRIISSDPALMQKVMEACS